MSPTDGVSTKCAFCDWKRIKAEEPYRWLEGDENSDYYVVLARNPKIMGHVLLISKEHYQDITKLDMDNPSTVNILKALVKWTKRIRDELLSDDEHGKVYVMTMCEHWEPDEIKLGWKEGDEPVSTTEHLHFHLLPRYKDMRKKETAAENLFMRPEDERWFGDMFKTLKNRLADSE